MKFWLVVLMAVLIASDSGHGGTNSGKGKGNGNGNPNNNGGNNGGGNGNGNNGGGNGNGNNGGGNGNGNNGGGGSNNGGGSGGNPGLPGNGGGLPTFPGLSGLSPLQLFGAALLVRNNNQDNYDYDFAPTRSSRSCPIGPPLRGSNGRVLKCNSCPDGSSCNSCPDGSSCINKLCCIDASAPKQKLLLRRSVSMAPLIPAVLVAKCLYGSPLKDVLGYDLYCGPANPFNRSPVICPVGSLCIAGPFGEYYACCAA